MAVHFKFKSARDFDTLSIDGPFITVSALKERIIEAKNLGKVADFDLVLTNVGTSEEYADDNTLVPKNTSLVVKRVPATKPRAKLQNSRKIDNGAKALDNQMPETDNADQLQVDDFGADLASQGQANADEEHKLKAAVIETATDWQQQNQQAVGRGGRGYGRAIFSGRGRGGGFSPGYPRRDPPPGYVCHRCGIVGHWIQDCPTNNDPDHDKRRVLKAPVGIPKSMLTTTADGTYVLPSGDFATLRPDESDFAKHRERLLANRPTARAIPPEYQCPLCSGLFRDAVLIPCCQESFCDQCIREELVKSGKCPNCGATNITNDDLLPNLTLRKAIERFKSEQAATTTTSSADKHLAVPDATVSQSMPKSPSPLPSQPPADIQTRNSSGAESSAPISAAGLQEHQRVAKSEAERALSASKGLDIGSEAVKAPVRSPQYESELPRPRSSGGPPLHKEMADAMIAQAGDWSDVNGGAGGLPYGGVAVNKARMKELQEQHRCLICGSPDHPTPDCPQRLMPEQYPGPFRGPELGPGGPYPPDFYPPAEGPFPGPRPYRSRPFMGPPYGPQGVPYGPEDMYFNGPVDPAWGPPFAGRGGPVPHAGLLPPRPAFDSFSRGPVGRGSLARPPIPSREDFERMQEEARRRLESKKRAEREESSDASERPSKKRDKEEKKHKKSRREKESRHESREGSRGEEQPEDEGDLETPKQSGKHRGSGRRRQYEEDDALEEHKKRRHESRSLQEEPRRRPESARRYKEDEHGEYDYSRPSRLNDYESKAEQSPAQHDVFARLRYDESDGGDRNKRTTSSHRSRSPVKYENDVRRQRGSASRTEYERQDEKPYRSSRSRRNEPIVEDDDRWTGNMD